ncbi:MAG: tRNA (guanosine(46)-N7)-methyltransferase TrmB [Mycobacterium sp.]|nr:MAG: tRNA (guanosine(46)-N7)-methyltransferase TrmB [Mycobacterium sp.]
MHAQGHPGATAPESALSATAPESALSATAPAPQHPRRVTSFRSRRAALSDTQQEVWARLWPRLGRLAVQNEQVGQNEQHGRPEPLDAERWFGRAAPGGVVLEIGCGTGTSTLAMAKAEPDIDVIAVEVYRRGLAQLLNGIDRDAVTNIRLIRGDGVDVLEQLVTPGSLTGVRVFFPDPWPKARHHKRRLLKPETVALIADRLRVGGVLHAATDHPGYAEQIAAVGDAEPRLRRATPAELAADPARGGLPISVTRPTTKYETKAQHAGSPVSELIWVRIAEG